MNNYRIRTCIFVCWTLCCYVAIPAFACNQPPVPGINDNVTPYAQYVPCGQYITLDGSWSYDPDGWITSYWWDIRRWNGSYYESYDDATSSSSSTSWSTSTPGQYRIELWVYDNDGDWSWSCDNCYVVHIRVTLDGGGYILVERNGDLDAITLSAEPDMDFGEIQLSKTCLGDGDIELYYDSQGTDPVGGVTLPKTWNLSRHIVPDTLYVKSISASSAVDDTTVTLSYVEDDQIVHSSSQAYTAVEMRIDPVGEFNGYLLVNDDDDDENGKKDNLNGGPLSRNDDDLVAFTLYANSPPDPEGNDKVRLIIWGLPESRESIKVWRDQRRTELILPRTEGEDELYYVDWDLSSYPTTIYVEGMNYTTGIGGGMGQFLKGDPHLFWEYWRDGLFLVPPNLEAQEFEWLTVLHVDMDMEGVSDELVSWPIDDSEKITEETVPGGVVPLNDFVKLTCYRVGGTGLNPDIILDGRGTVDKIEIWNLDKTEQIQLGEVIATNEQLPIELWVKGVENSDAPRDLSISLQCALGGETYEDEILLTVGAPQHYIDIISVPQYLFASATYATPIKFEVTGMGDHVYLHHVDVYLIIDGLLAGQLDGVGNRITAGDGTARGNGTSNIYTCYVPASFYGPLLAQGDAHRTDDIHFELDVHCSTDGLLPGVILSSSQYDFEAKVDMYFDIGVFAVEPGITGVHPYGEREYVISVTDGLQGAVDKEGLASYVHWKRDSSVAPYCDPAEWPVPHEEPATAEGGRAGMDYMWGSGGDEYRAEAHVYSLDQMTVETRLYDDPDSFGDPVLLEDQGCKARYYGLRRGGYFFISYRGRQLDAGILEPGEYSMDLTNTSVVYDWDLFTTGAVRFTNIATSSESLGIATAGSLATGIASLIAIPLSAGASVAFGVLSVAFGIIDAVDTDTGQLDGRAEGCFYIVHYRFPAGQDTPENPEPPQVYPQHGYVTGAPWDLHPAKVTNRAGSAGDQVVQFVELESDCSLESKLLGEAEAFQKTEFKCDTADDFHKMTIRVRDN